MSRRDLFLVASTAAISSLLTYLTCATMTAPPEVHHYESGAANRNLAAVPSEPDVNFVHVDPGKPGVDPAVSLQRDSSRLDDGNHSDNGPIQDSALAFRKRQELGTRFSSLFNGGGSPNPGAINARMENRFYLEEVNQEWADGKESNIRTLFEANENLSGIAPLQVACRSKNCQVVLSATSQDEVRLLSEKFMQAATKSDLGMQGKVVAFFPDISMGRLVFYLSENGNMDLFQ